MIGHGQIHGRISACTGIQSIDIGMQARPIRIGERGQVLQNRVRYEVGLVPSILQNSAVSHAVRDTFLFESCQWWVNHFDDCLSNNNGCKV